MRSIMYNLISNAIKFKGDESPVVRLHTKKEDDNVVLTVQDNGTGIPVNKLNKVFEMYGRLKMDIKGHALVYISQKK
jgi:two-component system CheB/CheR fusion protein